MIGFVTRSLGSLRSGGRWAWAILVLMTMPAIWHVVDFPSDLDPEFPGVERPTFSKMPPPAYRLAEPGDTIDRIALYLSAGAIVLATAGLLARRRSGSGSGLWPAAIGLGLAAFWHSATPGPTFDGWHGWGWRTIFDPAAPMGLRIGLAAAAGLLAAFVVGSILRARPRWSDLRASGSLGLFVAAVVLVALRQVEIPGVEPVGYWPRWAFVWGLLAFDLALIRSLPAVEAPRVRWAHRLGGVASLAVVVALGLNVTWYHRPLERLKAVVPGRIFISAMPSYRGLEVAHARHGFKTIINLFPEEIRPHPGHPDEVRFAREHGIRYVGSPTGATPAEDFLNLTLDLARDSEAWPILVHCHGCMDRTPAWMGIYRFVVEGKPLLAIMQEIEQHRGYRPKASVTMLYNRVLAPRAPGHYANDPTAATLQTCAAGVTDPYYDLLRRELEAANPAEAPRVSRRDDRPDEAVRRP